LACFLFFAGGTMVASARRLARPGALGWSAALLLAACTATVAAKPVPEINSAVS
jgi:hypothetical protein